MEFSEILNYILYIVLTSILPIVATYAVSLIKSKIKESNIIAQAAKNEEMSNLIKDALSDVMDAVLFINQIYTESLTASGQIDQKAQEEAFNRAYAEAVNMISDEAKKAVEQLYGSFDKWLRLKIESSVKLAKE